MSLRTVLVISFTALLLVVIATVGLVASRSIEEILVSQIDRTLFGFVDRGPHSRPPDSGSVPGPNEPLLQPFAEIFLASDGSVDFARNSGFIDDPDPLPSVDELEGVSGFVFLESADGSLRYRAYVDSQPDGSMVVRAAPLRDVANATAALVRTLLLTGTVVLLLGGGATWWTVRAAMKPVDQMVATAEAIAGGDLTRRVRVHSAKTELGRLGAALNEMLAHIELAFAAEREGQDRLRQFVADASHELRTPLAAVAGYAELRRKGGLTTPEEENNAWSRIERESGRMARLIEDLLTLARLGRTQPLEIAEVDLVEIAREAAEEHQAIDPDRPVTIKGPAAMRTSADNERLHQVVSNVLSNVRVHTPPGTLVEIELIDRDDTVEIRVSDDGPGIPEAALGHVFDRFFRGDPSRSRKSGGSGLGLAIVEAIVAAHRGTVTAENADGGGARITIRLPCGPSS